MAWKIELFIPVCCKKTFTTNEEAEEHEKSCHYNLNNRTCASCSNVECNDEGDHFCTSVEIRRSNGISPLVVVRDGAGSSAVSTFARQCPFWEKR